MTLEWSNYNFAKIPFENIVRVGQRSLLYRDLFTVSWLLGRFCNYHCAYCWPYARSDSKDHRPTQMCLDTIDEIKRQARERGFNSFHFSFSGGEPTLHPGYLNILSHYGADDKVNYSSVHMTTNLSPGLRWFDKYIGVTKSLHRVSITASWHRDPGLGKPNDKEKFADKLVYLQGHDVQVTINIVMVPDWWDKIWDEVSYFHGRGINVTLKPQSDEKASKVVDGYTPEMLDRLHNGMPQRDYVSERLASLGRVSTRPKYRGESLLEAEKDDPAAPQRMQVEFVDDQGHIHYMDQAERFNAFGFNRFQGWECSSGYRSIIIREPDGSVKRSYSCHDKPLGNIATGFKLFDSPQPCVTPTCVSSADSKIPKRQAGTQLPLWPGDRTYEKD